MNCLLVVAIAMNLIYTQNFPLRPETFETTLIVAKLVFYQTDGWTDTICCTTTAVCGKNVQVTQLSQRDRATP